MENRFNLIDEPWLPIMEVGRVSLKDVFIHPGYRGLGGNPIQKISLLNLLLAIVQAACTPKDEAEWRKLGWQGMCRKCLDYLEQWHDRFFLYGERPFLQMPEANKAEVKSYGLVTPQIAAGNTTVLTQSQIERYLEDSDKAVLLINLMGFALGGKKTDNKVTLTLGYTGKKPSGRSGPGMGYQGYLHSFFLGESLSLTLWLNLLTLEDVKNSNLFPNGVGVAPWEQMPKGEDCEIANALRNSLQGCLVPLSRFCLFGKYSFHYTEGIVYPDYKDGRMDPSMAVDLRSDPPKVLWADPGKRPWRELTALLSFISEKNKNHFSCLQLRAGLKRIRENIGSFAVWSGGLRVSNNAGEQYVTGADDYVESLVWLKSENMGEPWFDQLSLEMEGLDQLSRILYGCVGSFFSEQKMEKGAKLKLAAQASGLFWQLCERDFQELVDACAPDSTKRQVLRERFAVHAWEVYDRFCPWETARQLAAWAKHKPKFGKYLKPAGG
jgi:CRISPR system Cascade subunit CasA